MAQGSLLPHEDTRSQLGKFNFTKPLMFHKVLESKSSAATEKRVTRPLCRTWRRHPVGSSGPRFTPPPPPPVPAGRRGRKCSEDRPHPSPQPLFRGGARGSAAEGTHTRNTQRHQRPTTPSTSRRSQLYHCSRRCRTAPPPRNPRRFSGLQRSLSRSPPTHLQHLGPTVPTANSRRTGLI